MREDMFKVIVEHPRWGSRFPFKQRRAADLDEAAPARESIRYRHIDRKSLSENLNPLRRWLEGQVGRPWDKVFAELCEHIDRRSTVQQHIHQHVEDFVALKVVVIDGVARDARDWRMVALDDAWAPKLYVDPRTGILRRNLKAVAARVAVRRERKEHNFPGAPADRRDLAPDRQLHRLGGIWYEVTLAPIPPRAAKPGKWTAVPYDVVLHCSVHAFANDPKLGSANWWQYGHGERYAVAKRQLDRGELRRHGLHNDNE
jgi:hypothetical protein